VKDGFFPIHSGTAAGVFLVVLVLCGPAAATLIQPATTTATAPVFQLRQTIPLVTLAPETVACQPPCSCMERSRAEAAWGADGFTQCSEKACGYSSSSQGAVGQYCFRQKAATTVSTRLRTSLAAVTPPTTQAPVMVLTATIPPGADRDGDGIPDIRDNCPDIANPDQYDHDGDGVGDDCDTCAYTANPGQEDTLAGGNLDDREAPGYADTDGDGIGDRCDNCRFRPNSDQKDTDGDGIGDACDLCRNHADSLCDGKTNTSECYENLDGPYATYDDYDKDRIGDECDNCWKNYNPDQKDTDGDGVGDACDSCPRVPNHDQNDIDADGDGIADICDTCPAIFNPDQQQPDPGLGPAVASRVNACYGCSLPPLSAADDTNSNGIRDSCEPSLSLLFVPLNWEKSQAEFDHDVATQVRFFANGTGLKDCPQKIRVTILNVTTQNDKAFTCSRQDCGVDNVKDFVAGLGISADDYDIVVGVTAWPHCSDNSNVVGCSNLADTVWITSTFESVTAHEIGHIYGLADEYCSNPDGSTDCRCNDGDAASAACNTSGNDGAKSGDRNWLDGKLGCSPFDGSCCKGCSAANYDICCGGNGNIAGGKCIMSYADAPGPRAFCQHCADWLAPVPQLRCTQTVPRMNLSIVDVTLHITKAGAVTQDKLVLENGRASPDLPARGAYRLQVLDGNSNVSWERNFDLFFDYYGSRVSGADYANVSYDQRQVRYRIPYTGSEKKVEVFHGNDLIWSRDLDFCNHDGSCGPAETHETCPKDCPLTVKDTVCTPVQDSVCDPDCLPGIDPDCGTPLPLSIPPAPSLPLVAGGILVLALVAGTGWYVRKKREP